MEAERARRVEKDWAGTSCRSPFSQGTQPEGCHWEGTPACLHPTAGRWLQGGPWAWLAPRASVTVDTGQMTEMALHPHQPHPSCSSGTVCAPPAPCVFLVINGSFLFPESWTFTGETSVVN